MITFGAWLKRLCSILSDRGYADRTKEIFFEDTAHQDYELGMPPVESAKLFIQEWNP